MTVGRLVEYDKICFVIMPFGKKVVGETDIDFDLVYKTIFEPAIQAASLPEGGYLIPRRADSGFFSNVIDIEMFSLIEYSRFSVADITGLNANVFYEIGHRHRAHASGTAIFRRTGAKLPFDTRRIATFDYEPDPEQAAADSRSLVTRVLNESLKHNRLDSPVWVALSAQRALGSELNEILKDAENAVRLGDLIRAARRYREAIRVQATNPLLHLELGLLLKDLNDWVGALEEFDRAVYYDETLAEAHRELGVAENKVYCETDPSRRTGLPSGKASLRRAISLNPDDYDAHASLGGILKREGLLDEALAAYGRATELSRGHSYPLLNALKLHARIRGTVELEPFARFSLRRAEKNLTAQVNQSPPQNAPWSYFDLAEVRLYLGDPEGFLHRLDEGILSCASVWQARTFRESLQLLVDGGLAVRGLSEGIAKLDEGIEHLKAM